MHELLFSLFVFRLYSIKTDWILLNQFAVFSVVQCKNEMQKKEEKDRGGGNSLATCAPVRTWLLRPDKFRRVVFLRGYSGQSAWSAHDSLLDHVGNEKQEVTLDGRLISLIQPLTAGPCTHNRLFKACSSTCPVVCLRSVL